MFPYGGINSGGSNVAKRSKARESQRDDAQPNVAKRSKARTKSAGNSVPNRAVFNFVRKHAGRPHLNSLVFQRLTRGFCF